eukprot:1714107-Pleurochrysis_carterae.AAC.1
MHARRPFAQKRGDAHNMSVDSQARRRCLTQAQAREKDKRTRAELLPPCDMNTAARGNALDGEQGASGKQDVSCYGVRHAIARLKQCGSTLESAVRAIQSCLDLERINLYLTLSNVVLSALLSPILPFSQSQKGIPQKGAGRHREALCDESTRAGVVFAHSPARVLVSVPNLSLFLLAFHMRTSTTRHASTLRKVLLMHP